VASLAFSLFSQAEHEHFLGDVLFSVESLEILLPPTSSKTFRRMVEDLPRLLRVPFHVSTKSTVTSRFLRPLSLSTPTLNKSSSRSTMAKVHKLVALLDLLPVLRVTTESSRTDLRPLKNLRTRNKLRLLPRSKRILAKSTQWKRSPNTTRKTIVG